MIPVSKLALTRLPLPNELRLLAPFVDSPGPLAPLVLLLATPRVEGPFFVPDSPLINRFFTICGVSRSGRGSIISFAAPFGGGVPTVPPLPGFSWNSNCRTRDLLGCAADGGGISS